MGGRGGEFRGESERSTRRLKEGSFFFVLLFLFIGGTEESIFFVIGVGIVENEAHPGCQRSLVNRRFGRRVGVQTP